MKNNRVIIGLDLGSGTIKIAVGELILTDLEIIAAIDHPSAGISKGVITDLEEVVSSLSAALEKVERIVGFGLETVNVGISGLNLLSEESRGVVAISRAEGEIKKEDVSRALEAAQTIATPPNYEILHVIPKVFKVDNQIGIKDPVGMTGVRLEVEVQIILDLSRQIKNLIYCLHRTGLEIERIIFSALATAEAVLDKKQKDLGVAVLDLGESTTHLIVYEEGDILTAKVLPIGSRDITSAIAIALRSSIPTAEQVKLSLGTADFRKVKKNEKFDLKDFDESQDEQVSRYFLSKVITEKCEEIFKLADKELLSIGRSRKLPSGVILTGAGSKLPGLKERAKEVLKLPVFLGRPIGFASDLKEAFDPKFTTAIGLILWAKEEKGRFGPEIRDHRGIFSQVKKWFKNLLPY